MKNLSSKRSGSMKLLLVMAVCAGMMLPAVASADYTFNETFESGSYTRTVDVLKNRGLSFNLTNGKDGRNVVSSVKVTLRGEKGKGKLVVISPEQFNQNHSEISTMGVSIGSDKLKPLMGADSGEVDVEIKVGGPKGSNIMLKVAPGWMLSQPVGPSAWR